MNEPSVSNFNFTPLTGSSFNHSQIDGDRDPDNHILNNLSWDCQYYTENQFIKIISEIKGFSVIHFNSRSLRANFDKIKSYLTDLGKSFDIVAITETWTKPDSEYYLDGYDFNCISRLDKQGGGVALFIKNTLKYNIIDSLSSTIPGCCEYISATIHVNKFTKPIFISCAYCAPGSDLNIFSEQLFDIVKFAKGRKLFICGDWNIDLLKHEVNSDTNCFIDNCFSSGIYPLIIKPTRVTETSATLIDNIFTSDAYSSIKKWYFN